MTCQHVCWKNKQIILGDNTKYLVKVKLLTNFLSLSSRNLFQIRVLPQMKLDGKHWYKYCTLSTDFFWSSESSKQQSCPMPTSWLCMFSSCIAAWRAIYHKTTGSWLGEWGYISYRHSVGQNYCSVGAGPLKKGKIGIYILLCLCVYNEFVSLCLRIYTVHVYLLRFVSV